jgi:PAS domain S-box-containing protein
MSGILEDQMLANFDDLPMTIDANSTSDGVEKSYTPLNAIMPHRNIGTGTVDMPLSDNSSLPLPTGFGAQSTLPVGSTLAEFTRRRNWSQRIVEELEDFLHILTPDGRIIYLSPSGKRLTGYPQEELLGKYIIDYIHQDDSGIFMRDFNESIACGVPLQLFYRFRKRDGTYTIFESRGHPHLASGGATIGSDNAASVCLGYFMMARPYPTKNAALLDSFLEQKIENERLTKRINDLKREEVEEAEEEQRRWQMKQSWHTDIPSEGIDTMDGILSSTPLSPRLANHHATAMPPPAKPSPVNSGLTRENLEDANANRKPDSLSDKMARYEGVTHIETIEMLTGLRYQDGERSHGISTGDQSPTLVRGDAGIAIPINKEAKGGDKKKKVKLPDEYVCTDCGKDHYLSPISRANCNARHFGFTRVAQGTKWTKDALQRLWASMGQEREAEIVFSPGSFDASFPPQIKNQLVVSRGDLIF